MIDSFLRFLEFEKRYSKHTLKSYHTDLFQFELFIQAQFSGFTIINADHRILRAWVVSLVEHDIEPRSINRKIATMRSFYKFLLAREEIDRDPTIKIKALKIKKPLPSFVKEEDLTRLFDHNTFEDNFSGWRDKLLMELLYSTGIRLSELVNLRESDIDSFNKTIKVLGKRNKERIIPFPYNLLDVIQKYKEKKKIAFNDNCAVQLIVTNSGKQCYPMMIYRVVRKYLDVFASSDKRSPHILRHSFATHLLNKGAELNAVKDLLGHTSLAATQVYTHNTIDKLKSIFDQAHPKA